MCIEVYGFRRSIERRCRLVDLGVFSFVILGYFFCVGGF